MTAAYRVSDAGTEIHLEFLFQEDDPAAFFAVTVRYADGEEASLARSDAEGAVRFRPTRRSACTVSARGGGHGVDLEIPATVIGPVYDLLHLVDGAPTATSRATVQAGTSDPSTAPPWIEALVSVGFVALLALVTLVLMRLAGRRSAVAEGDRQALLREVDELRAEVRRLRRERGES